MTDRPINMLSNSDQQEVIELAKLLSKTVGRNRPSIVLNAAFLLIECAAMAGDPDAYIDWKIKMDAKYGSAQ